MADIDKLKINIDRDECIGDGLCANEAPETFEMDDESKAVLLEGSTDSAGSAFVEGVVAGRKEGARAGSPQGVAKSATTTEHARKRTRPGFPSDRKPVGRA